MSFFNNYKREKKKNENEKINAEGLKIKYKIM